MKIIPINVIVTMEVVFHSDGSHSHKIKIKKGEKNDKRK